MLLGYETSEREHYSAAELVWQVCKRQIWGLPDTREVAYVAPLPPTIVPKGNYSDGTIIEAMFRKCFASSSPASTPATSISPP